MKDNTWYAGKGRNSTGLIKKGSKRFYFNSYQEYLNSNHWKGIRAEYYKRRTRNYCYVCKTTENLNIHHRYYKVKDMNILFNERWHDLFTLCRGCHKLWHKYWHNAYFSNKKLSRLHNLLEAGLPVEEAFLRIAGNKYKTTLNQIKNNVYQDSLIPTAS